MGRGGDGASRQRVITLDELRKHNREDDCWVAVNKKVYDVSGWKAHPGGNVLFTHAGADATAAFDAFHSKAAYNTLAEHHVGTLAEEPATVTEFERAVRKLQQDARAAGLFEASPLYYVWKVVSTTALGAFTAWVTLSTTTWLGKFAGAALLALFWQQCGWLAHDFLHHQVFKNRWLNDMMGLVVGDLYQGFSVAWWKAKHNTHHAIPNLLESAPEAHDGDPDIDTLPFLAWSVESLAKVLDPKSPAASASARFFTRFQALLYFPILFFARLTWSLQSFAYVFDVSAAYWGASAKTAGLQSNGKTAHASRLRYPVGEKIGIAGHYAWVFALAYVGCGYSVLGAAAYLVAAQTLGGLLLAVAFGVGHNGMAVYAPGKQPGFAELQISTTRNVENDMFGLTGWFMGGLHLQVEHHMCPMVPRHNLAKLRAMVEPLCKKYGVPYRSTGLWEGNKEVLSHLAAVSEGIRSFPAM